MTDKWRRCHRRDILRILTFVITLVALLALGCGGGDGNAQPTARTIALLATSTPLPTVTSTDVPEATATPEPKVRRIAFTCGADICSVGTDGSGLINLTNTLRASEFFYAWFPDGTRIAFSSDRDGNSEIYVMNADGSSPINLTNSPDHDGSFAWSPDGKRIAFTRAHEFNSELYIMNADGSDVTRVTNTPSSEISHVNRPAWSPDGSRIAFVSSSPPFYLDI